MTLGVEGGLEEFFPFTLYPSLMFSNSKDLGSESSKIMKGF